jgi:hypothetical protein
LQRFCNYSSQNIPVTENVANDPICATSCQHFKVRSSCASVATSSTNGYYALDIQDSVGHYFDVSVSRSAFSSVCQFSSSVGLTYHIHQSWTSSSSSLSGSSNCGASNTGGHYDPYIACSSASQYVASYCTDINRTLSQGYSYPCNSTVFAAGQYRAAR